MRFNSPPPPRHFFRANHTQVSFRAFVKLYGIQREQIFLTGKFDMAILQYQFKHSINVYRNYNWFLISFKKFVFKRTATTIEVGKSSMPSSLLWCFVPKSWKKCRVIWSTRLVRSRNIRLISFLTSLLAFRIISDFCEWVSRFLGSLRIYFFTRPNFRLCPSHHRYY